MRINRILKIQYGINSFHLYMENGDERILDYNQIKLHFADLNDEDIAAARLHDGNLVFPTRPLTFTDLDGNKKTEPMDIDPEFILYHSKSLGYSPQFADIIMRLMKTQNMTAKELAEKVEIKEPYLSRILNHKTDVEYMTAQRILYKGFDMRLDVVEGPIPLEKEIMVFT